MVGVSSLSRSPRKGWAAFFVSVLVGDLVMSFVGLMRPRGFFRVFAGAWNPAA